MVNVRWTLYRIHDMDLITLETNYDLSLCKMLKECLKAFASGEVFVYQLPHYNIDNKALARSKEYKKLYQKTLVLDEKKDKEAIDIINRIEVKGRNAFFKMLLRLYLCNPITSFYVEEENLLYLNEKLIIFKSGRTILDADTTDKRKDSTSIRPKKTDRIQPVKEKVEKIKTQPIEKEVEQENVYKEPLLMQEDSEIAEEQNSADDIVLNFLSSVGR